MGHTEWGQLRQAAVVLVGVVSSQGEEVASLGVRQTQGQILLPHGLVCDSKTPLRFLSLSHLTCRLH